MARDPYAWWPGRREAVRLPPIPINIYNMGIISLQEKHGFVVICKKDYSIKEIIKN